MKELFVSYNVASLAKEKGFDEPCLAYYFPSKKEIRLSLVTQMEEGYSYITNSMITVKEVIATPLYQQLIDWFREKHTTRIVDDIQSGTMSGRLLSSYKFNAIKIDGLYTKDVLKYSKIENKSFPSYYEALDKTLETILLRIKK